MVHFAIGWRAFVLLFLLVSFAAASELQFSTLITDTLDKTLANRINTRSEDSYTTFITTNDVNADGLNSLSPLRGYSDGTLGTNLYQIGGDQFSGFKDRQVTDPQAGGDFAYTARQAFWVGSGTDEVK
ncbi:MAG: hypothetical protein WC492_04460, partial [Candidatus Micrarchaeia archaeon]